MMQGNRLACLLNATIGYINCLFINNMLTHLLLSLTTKIEIIGFFSNHLLSL
jgi:hypothetical protein